MLPIVTVVSSAKTAEPIEMLFRLRTLVGPRNHMDPHPLYEGTILRGKRQPIVKYRDTVVICAKTAELIKMPFGIWTWVGSCKGAIFRGKDMPGKPEVTLPLPYAVQKWLNP